MFLPAQMSTQRITRSLQSFGGYRHDQRADAAHFYDMENLSADRFPLLSTRARRGKLAALAKPNGLWTVNGALLWVDGTELYYGGECVGTLTDTKKSFVTLGTQVLIWPDKMKFDPATRALTPLGASFTSSGTVSFSMCNLLGDSYAAYSVSDMPPENPSGGALWLDTAQTPNVLKRYSSLSAMWISVSAAYIKISGTGLGAAFREYDGVHISGAALEALNTSAVVYGVGTDYILIAGTLDAAFTQNTPLHISREIPDFDFLCEKDNRVWGCSSARNEIGCCKLGDPGNWSCYMGIGTDSYTLCVGSGGEFTGCSAYGSNLLFFKEDRIFKLMGTKPENYQLTTTLCHGVSKGAEKSLVQLGGTLYYHARSGVYAYGGALPEPVGKELGMQLIGAVGGVSSEKYYLSAEDAAGKHHLFVFDERCGLWHREDASEALDIVNCGGDAYMLRSDGAILSLGGGEGEKESIFPWFFETGELIEGGYARPQKLVLRVLAGAESSIRVRLSYDGGDFETVGHVRVTRKRLAVLPLRLRRCDSLRLRCEGEGEFELHGFSFVSEEALH